MLSYFCAVGCFLKEANVARLPQKDEAQEDILTELKFYLKQARALFFDDDLKRDSDFIFSGLMDLDRRLMLLKYCLLI
ncbi:hypothetical protein EAW55_00840 [Legionella jordanis]|nr:hypothetical protein EAW55_00840 [Legionella jordanis]